VHLLFAGAKKTADAAWQAPGAHAGRNERAHSRYSRPEKSDVTAVDSLFLSNLTSPPLLFFFLGAFAAFVRSDLEVPTPVAKFLSLYLLMAIGFKGGVALAEAELGGAVFRDLLAAVLLASIVPAWVFFIMRRRLSVADAAAVAATYGSISAVTFVACTSYLDSVSVDWGGHMVAAMALMESPAIIIGILLYRVYKSREDGEGSSVRPSELLRDALLNGSVLLILGALLIGWATGTRGMDQIAPFVKAPFVGVLCLFLLDMGLVAARRFRDLFQVGRPRQSVMPTSYLVITALIFPFLNATVAGLVAWQLGLPEGDALLLTVLGASASYIAVPAAMRLALPESNPSVYLPMSLAVTFPLNLLVGIPLYHQLLRSVMGIGATG